MTEFLKQTIGQRVRAARKAVSQTQEQLAEEVGCTIESISNIERGVSLPTIRTLSRISSILGISLRDMFPDEIDSLGPKAEKRAQLNALFTRLTDADADAVLAMIATLADKRAGQDRTNNNP